LVFIRPRFISAHSSGEPKSFSRPAGRKLSTAPFTQLFCPSQKLLAALRGFMLGDALRE
jgi:hypothetical protein